MARMRTLSKQMGAGPASMEMVFSYPESLTDGMGPTDLRDYYLPRMMAVRRIVGNVINGQGVNVVAGEHPLRAFAKADFGYATTGAFNTIFGAETWPQVVQNANAAGAIRKDGWPRSGFRIKTATGITGGLGVAHGSTVAAAVTFTPVQISVKPKQLLPPPLGFTRVLDEIQRKDDAITWDEALRHYQMEVANQFDKDILADASVADPATLNDFEGIDRIYLSHAVLVSQGYAAGRDVLYGRAKNGNTEWDGNAQYVNGAISISAMDKLISDSWPYWTPEGQGPSGAFLVTGPDTLNDFNELLHAQRRYEVFDGAYTFDGLKSMKGQDGGTIFPSFNGIPWVGDPNVKKDTKSRVYLAHNHYLSQRWAAPLRAAFSEDLFVVGTNKRVDMEGIGELVCMKPHSGGELVALT